MERLNEDLGLSPITLGTMRFFDKALSRKQITEIIETCFEGGIKTHHSSFEYNSYDLYSSALRKASCRSHIKHIVKLSSPHFKENSFSSKILSKRVEDQLKTLNIDCLDVLQWLVRSKPINDKDRLSILKEQEEAIKDCMIQLKKDGKIKSVFSFPYSVGFAHEVIKLEEIDGIIAYLNKVETDYSDFANKYPFIAIRPLNAGSLVSSQNTAEDIQSSLAYVKKHTKVRTQIVSINSVAHVQAFIA